MRNQFPLHTSRITDFQMHGVRNSRNGRLAVTSFTIHGQHAMPTRSFWKWLISKFADQQLDEFSEFEFDEAEFFDRLRVEKPNAEIEYEIGWDDDGNALLRAPLEKQLSDETTEAQHGNRLSRFVSQAPTRRLDQTRELDDAYRYFMTSSPGTPRFSLN